MVKVYEVNGRYIISGVAREGQGDRCPRAPEIGGAVRPG